MSIYKYILSLLIATSFSLGAAAQNGASSPVSRYGYGQLTDMVIGRSAAMGGASLGLRAGQEVNVSNPASYSAVDSLTFLFDAGVSLENVNYSNGKDRKNHKDGQFDYIAMNFRLRKGLGFAIGLAPYSKIGYDFSSTDQQVSDMYGTTTMGIRYYGLGGLTRGFVGVGWKPLGGLSVGANLEYVYGDLFHEVASVFSNTNAYSINRTYAARISTLNTTLGVQYELPLGKVDRLTLGGTFTPGHNVNDTAYRGVDLDDDDSETVMEVHQDSILNAFQMPTSFGLGAAYQRGNQLTVALDYNYQNWGNVKFPMSTEQGFSSEKGHLKNRHKVSLGAEYIPNYMSRNYLRRIRYRAGMYYANQYARVDQYEAGKEFCLTAGVGLPIQNQWNNRSVVNVSFQWIHVSPSVSQLLVENYFRLCIGLTFDERWFMKFKID